ncbi:hypothetical protein BZA77DRAFT_376786 [Pyronema omphalodes]|nr:hypothetical protein BZA77DRAFT_376786 [Pyronema omphalodes]
MWVAQPPYRGTWGILYSCTVTLGLCVYTAIHLNIPAYDDKPAKIWLRKIKWMLIALTAPEIVLYTAWSQWYQARKICKALNKTRLNAESDTASYVKHYDLMMGYYIIMGGFISARTDGKYVVLTAADILDCARRSKFPRVDKRAIRDKSKADILAKFLVCSQVIWTVIETSARKVSAYPLSLLEVHVFVHVVCALSMYALWFSKPMDIQSPEVLHDVNISESNDKLRRSRAPNIYALSVPDNNWLLIISLIIMCALYGGIHLSTWHFAFPSNTERFMWNISGIITVSASLVAPGWLWWASRIIKHSFVGDHGNFSIQYNCRGNSFDRTMQQCLLQYKRPDSGSSTFLHITAYIAIVTSPVVLAARLFLVVESFISLRSVPAGVYVTVPWAQYIPHL